MLYLGIDGGGSGCRAAVADASGRIIGRGQAGPANILSDTAGALSNILQAAMQALQASGGRPDGVRAVLGLAGANVGIRVDDIRAGLPFAARIETDAMIALAGAHQGQDGVIASIGTGSVFASQRRGNMQTVGGWGLVLGDEGAGAWMGRELLRRLVRAEDGLIKWSSLLLALRDDIGGAAAAVAFARTASPADFAQHARRITESADDSAALAILAEADTWIARAIDHLMLPGAVPLAFLGGLGPLFAVRLAQHYPRLIRLPLGDGLDGALWLARQGG